MWLLKTSTHSHRRSTVRGHDCPRISLQLILPLLACLLFATSSYATPPEWEASLGSDVDVDDGDDGSGSVELSFSFPFAGSSYDWITIHTDGGVTLGAETGVLEYYCWESTSFPDLFANRGLPVIAGFLADLNSGDGGRLRFNDFGDHAVVTWSSVPSYSATDDGAPFWISFQIALWSDGKIAISWSNVAGDLIAGLSSGIIVGLSEGNVTTPGASTDLSLGGALSGALIYQVWCYDEDPNEIANSECIDPGEDDNSGFDFADHSLVLTPNGPSAFTSTVTEGDGVALAGTEYDPSLGSVLNLSYEDDLHENVSINFSFPFDGQTYDTIAVSTNGGIVLGSDVIELDYDTWRNSSFAPGFADRGSPVLAGFLADLNPGSSGLIQFLDLGDEAIISWNRVEGYGSSSDGPDFHVTFQITLRDDGTIIYDFGDLDGDAVDGIESGIVVGVAEGGQSSPYTSVDLSIGGLQTIDPIFEAWCFDEDPNAPPNSSACIDPGHANNSGFDLEGLQMSFTPEQAGGFTVTVPEPNRSVLGLAAVVVLGCLVSERRASCLRR